MVAENETTLKDEERAFRATDDDAQAEILPSTSKTHDMLTSTTKTNGAPMGAGQGHPYRFVPLRMGGNGRTHMPTADSAALVDEIGGLATLERMTTFFYNKAFSDATIDKFIHSHNHPHASRFSKWIHQKVSYSPPYLYSSLYCIVLSQSIYHLFTKSLLQAQFGMKTVHLGLTNPSGLQVVTK